MIEPGSRLAHYEIVEPVGKGGMGEVWRARDTRLGRDVAVKTLPAEFAQDRDRLARFEREAKLLASLNHPNIATIHGFEEDGGMHFLVMELVEGETLADRIRQGAIPVGESLALASQIVGALEAAHEKGVLHRDLKPANIKVTPEGKVKVLDFGLAKAFSGERLHANTSNSPTLSFEATQQGMVMGTAGYMSPEQARGRPADQRADIWAFGVVLYEMLSGRRAFEDEDVSMILSKVLQQDPDWGALPADLPPGVDIYLRRCLHKDPRQRVQSSGDLRLALSGAFEPAAPSSSSSPGRERARMRLWPVLGALVAGGLLALTPSWILKPEAGGAGVTRLSIALPYGHVLADGPAISRDGRRVAFVSSDGVEPPQLYVRDLGENSSRLINGTAYAEQPFFSPNGESIAFYSQGALFRVDLAGGAPVRLARSPSHDGGTWLEDGRILFTQTWNGGLFAIDANGGAAKGLTVVADEWAAHAWPHAIPGTNSIIFNKWGTTSNGIFRLDLGTMIEERVGTGFRKAVYVPTGHLVFGSDSQGELWAKTLDLDGGPAERVVSVIEGMDTGGPLGDARFGISDSGTLVYAPRDPRRRSVVVVGASGAVSGLGLPERSYEYLAAWSDGHQAVASSNGDLMLLDLDRRIVAPLAPGEPGYKILPVWDADNRRILFASAVGGDFDIRSIAVSGNSEAQTVLQAPLDQFPDSVAPDGAILFHQDHPDTSSDIWIMIPGQDPKPWMATPARETYPSFSSDGNLVAYQSDVSGRVEAYIGTRESNAERIQVSVDGGSFPVWSPQTDQLFFLRGNAMFRVAVHRRNGLSADVPVKLFDGGRELVGESFAVMPSGESFLMIRSAPEAISDRIEVIQNWFEELKRLVPVD